MPASAVAVAAEANKAADTRPAPAPMRISLGIVRAVPPPLRERLGDGGPSQPLASACDRRQAPPPKPLLNQIGQKAQETCALDRPGKLPLLLGGNRGDPARHDLAALRNVALQQLHVLVVDLRRLIAGERAGLAPAVEGAARRDFGSCSLDIVSSSRRRRRPR